MSNKQKQRLRAKMKQHERCYYCRTMFPRGQMTIDHDVPRSRGGTLAQGNTHYACAKCNVEKGDRTAAEFAEVKAKELGFAV